MISQFIRVYPELEDAISSRIKLEKIPKKNILLNLGQVSTKKYFILKGLIRSYYYRDGQEITNWFKMENQIAFSLLSFCRRQPSFEIIETLEDCELISWTFEDAKEWHADHAEVNIVTRKLIEQHCCESEERMIAMRKQSAVDRYRELMENNPAIIKRVSNKIIATYLGMSEGNLSRIKLNLRAV